MGISTKLEEARTGQDQAKIIKFESQLEQRKNKYGVHWDSEGKSTINADDYPNIDLEFIER